TRLRHWPHTRASPPASGPRTFASPPHAACWPVPASRSRAKECVRAVAIRPPVRRKLEIHPRRAGHGSWWDLIGSRSGEPKMPRPFLPKIVALALTVVAVLLPSAHAQDESNVDVVGLVLDLLADSDKDMRALG